MPDVERTKREVMIVNAMADGISGVASGMIIASFLLLIAGVFGLLWNIFTAVIILYFVGFNLHKAYKAFNLAHVKLLEAYQEPITEEAYTDVQWKAKNAR